MFKSEFITNNWGKIILFTILLVIIIINFKSGYFILGNDNYSPELNPNLTLERSLENPAWRSYRVLGIPSDSEQADIFRSALFSGLAVIFPKWLISQGYVFFAFFIGSISTAYLCLDIAKRHSKYKNLEVLFLFAGLFYTANLATSWMMFSPLKVFLAGYAFLPFVLWRLSRVYVKFNPVNIFWLVLSVLFFTTSGMVATTFIVESGIILFFFLYFFITSQYSVKKTILITLVGLIIIFGSQLFWILPFIQYVKTNSAALQESYINRVLTPELIEQEVKYNKPFDVFRFYYSWIDWVNNDGTFQYAYREWYSISIWGRMLGFIPLFFAFIGILWSVIKKSWRLALLSLLLFGGWFIIKGVNEPFGSVFIFLQETIPLFKQVFRWQSSKVFSTLTLSISLFGSLGVLYVYKKLEYLPFVSIAKSIFVLILLGSSLIYVYPFFQKGLIGTNSYVKIPSEYEELRVFLEKNDPLQRIYIAPEANTLYFRSYSWGFFGSSFLNYLIPNPIVERALYTGSFENETAQSLLEQSYYSGDQKMFQETLATFNTPLVLLDKNASKGQNGYEYDLNLMDKQIEFNPFLSKIWENNNLSLYKLVEENNISQLYPVYSGHDWQKLQQIQLSTGLDFDFYSNDNISGIMYPFALTTNEIDSGESGIVTSTIYRGQETSYSFIESNSNIQSYPTKIELDKNNNSIILSSAVPRIIVQNSIFEPSVLRSSYDLEKASKYITLNNSVLDLSTVLTNGIVIENSYSESINSVKQWGSKASVLEFSKIFQDKNIIKTTKNSIGEIKFKASSLVPSQVNICAYSTLLARCINNDISFYLNSASQEVTVLITDLIKPEDRIEIYVKVPVADNMRFITIESYKVNLYSESSELKKIEENAEYKSTTSDKLTLEPNDVIKVVIPKIIGRNSYHFQKENQLGFDISHKYDCDREIYTSFLRKENTDRLRFESLDCNDQAVIKMEQLEPQNIGMIYYKGQNISGIPTILSLRKSKSARKNYEDRLLYENKTNKLSFIILPPEVETYHIELYNYGLGPRPSINIVEDLSFEFIPKEWYTLQLIPDNMQVLSNNNGGLERIISINDAIHPNWNINSNSNAESIRINGWQQGWLTDEVIKGDISINYWPNQLVNWGYYFHIVLGTVVGILLISSVFQKKNE